MVLPAFSQIKFGLKLGANTATVPTYKISSGTNNIETVKNAQWGIQAGAFLRIGIKSLYIQPEIMLASNSYDYTVTTVTGQDLLHQKFTRLEIPVLLGIKLGPLHINAGPSANINIGSPKALIVDPDFVDLYRSATFGYQAGIGVDLFKRLVIDARYGGSLSERFGSSVTIGNQTFNLDSRQPSFILSLGIMF
jgi:hypothetical protein